MSALPTLCAVDLRVIDGEAEPRIHDLRLAERLGFERPRAIRQLIERNLADLETYGRLPRAVATSHDGSGARPVEEYWLNEGQVVRLCTLSKTPFAAMVTKEAIDVFLAYRHGRLAPAFPLAEEILGEVRGLRVDIADLRREQKEQGAEIIFLAKRVDDLAPRRNPSEETICGAAWTAFKRYNSECPSCRGVKIVDEVGKPIRGVFNWDHFRGRECNSAEDGWPVCASCNQKLIKFEFKESRRAHFAVYQENRAQMTGPLRLTASQKRRDRGGSQGDLFG